MGKLLYVLLWPLLLIPGITLAAEGGQRLDLTGEWVGFTAIGIFIAAYALVMAEEFTHLRKSKPVLLAAGLIWALIAWVYQAHPEVAAGQSAQGLLAGGF